jgi:hypothetical protein
MRVQNPQTGGTPLDWTHDMFVHPIALGPASFALAYHLGLCYDYDQTLLFFPESPAGAICDKGHPWMPFAPSA